MEDNQVLNTNTEVSEQTEGTVETQPEDTKTFTQEDLDRIVTKRLEKESKKWEAKFNAFEEAQKLSQMNEEQKQEYDYTKRLEELTQREQELEAKINAYNQQQYKHTIEAQLNEAGLPTAMSDLLINMDAEAVANQINVMKQSFDTQLNAQLSAKVQASATTPVQPTEQVKLLSLDEIKAMSSTEYMANKQLVEQSLKALSK